MLDHLLSDDDYPKYALVYASSSIPTAYFLASSCIWSGSTLKDNCKQLDEHMWSRKVAWAEVVPRLVYSNLIS